MTLNTLVISLIYALILVHEMDAIYNKEWKMFIILKDLKDRTAYLVFTLIHIPLYMILIYLTITLTDKSILFIVIDIFLVAHGILHLLFEKHKDNQLKNLLSRFLIYVMGILGIIHLLMTLAY